MDDLRMKHKASQTTVLIQYSTIKMTFGNLQYLNVTDWEKVSHLAQLMNQFECLGMIGDAVEICRFKG